MIALILPEPVPWEGALRAELGPHRVFRVPLAGRGLGRLSVARRIRARLTLRQTVGRLAARWLPRNAHTVLAPSLAAEEVFAVARRRGIRTVLLEDLPDLAGLHHDLDAAAQRHPDQAFLRNARAPTSVLLRQSRERALADALRVQSRYAADLRGGTPLVHPEPAAPTRRTQHDAFGLAGPAMTRAGVFEALALLDQFPDHRLRLRPIDATPAEVLRHPRVSTQPGPVDVWLAPSWVEAWPAEVRQASRDGVPVVGTARALGWVDGWTHAPGDTDGLICTVAHCLEGTDRSHSLSPVVAPISPSP